MNPNALHAAQALKRSRAFVLRALVLSRFLYSALQLIP